MNKFHHPISIIGLVCLAIAAFSPASRAQVRPTHRPDVPNFDNRTAPVQTPLQVAKQEAALAHLKSQLPSTTVDFDELLGTPKFIRAPEGFLTGPNGQGRAVSAQAAQNAAPNDPHAPIKAFLKEHTALFGHGAEALTAARVKRNYVDAHNGLRTVVWEQQLDGIPIYKTVLMGHITRKGELTSLSSTFVPDPTSSANLGTPGRAGLQSQPPISAREAILLAAQNIGFNLATNQIVPAGGPAGDGEYLVFKTPQEAYVRLVWLPLHRSALRLAWEVMVSSRVTNERFRVLIDAQTGSAWLREGLTFYISDATYNVFTSDSPSPFSPGLQTPGTFQPPLTNRVLVTTPALDTTASPDGWIPDGGNTTTGNNVDTFVDRNYNQQPDQTRPQGNPNRVFNFTLDLTQDPTNYIDAATTELFYKCNYYHDVLYQLGFTEAAGNFQQNNFGRGGFGNDRIIAYVQAGADVGLADNAYFATPPDGFNGECAMFVWDFPVPQRDGSLDSDVFFHEFTHGTSWRLVGGGNNLGNIQGDGMGEGWSDFFALSLSSEPGDDPNAAYAMGGYVTYQLAGLNQNYYYGIRHFPYCTDLTRNPFTFKDIDPNQIDPHTGVPRSPLYPFDSNEASEVHHQGEIWCVTLWEVRANLIAKYGSTAGNQLMLQLVTDGLKLTPGRPTFMQARDAILLADRINNSGANNIEIWRGFAKRGMGASAVSPPNTTTAGVIEGYDFPSLTVDRVAINGGNGNGIIDPNECNDLTILLLNNNNTNASGISAQLFTSTKGVLVAQTSSTYPDILPGATNANFTPFKISTAPTFVCGTPVDFSLVIRTAQEKRTNAFRLASGTNGLPVRFDNNTSVAIPDDSPAGVTSPIIVSNINSVVGKVVVSAHIAHTADSQLTLQLISPGGTTNILSAAHGGTGDNYGTACSPGALRTTFDDAAAIPISAATAPFVGTFKPDQPLANFAGKAGTNVNGAWKLRVVDSGPGNVGTVQCWSLFLSPATCTDGGGECPGVDLAISMIASPDPVVVGLNLVYTITVTNAGPDTARNTVIVQSLPASAGYVSGTVSQGSISQSGGVVTANLGNLPATGTATASVVVTNAVPGTVSSTATISSSNPEFDQSNNSSTFVSHVAPPTSDLALGIASAPNPALVGSPLTYTISVTNNGPSTATSVVSSNSLPASVGLLSVSNSQGTFSVAGNTVLCNFGSVLSQSRATAAITVIPGTPGTIVANSVVYGSTNEIDPVPGNNFTSASVIVNPAADLTVAFLSAPAAVVVRSNFTYTIGATNRGPNDASGVVLNHTLPPNSILVSSNATQGTFSFGGGVLACNVGALPVGAGVSLTVVVAVTNAATVSSVVTVSSSQADANTTNNTATATTLVSAPFVAVVPSGSALLYEYFTNGTPGFTNGAIDIGETATLSFSLRNVGNVITTNLITATLQTNSGILPAQPNSPQTFELLAPGGDPKARPFTFKAAGANGATITAVLRLKDGATDLGTASFDFALPSLSTFANTNRIDVPTPQQDQLDPGPAGPYPSAILVSGVTGLVGKVTVTLSNLNHTFPHDLNILLVGPTGPKVLLMSDAADGSSVSAANVTFDDSAASTLPGFGQIFSGSYRPSSYDPSAEFSAPAPAGPFSAALAALSGTDPNGLWSLYLFDDSGGDFGNIANGWSLAISAATPLYKPTDLSVAGISTPASVRVGNYFTNTFIVTNAGPSKSGGLWFTNVLPATAALVSATNSVQTAFAANGNALACYLGDSLDVGSTVTVTLVLTPVATNSPLTISGTVVVTNGAIDLNLANNTVSTITTVLLPLVDVRVTQTLAPNPAVVGYPLTATVTISNSGPGTAFNVLLTNTLPAGVGLVSTTPSGAYLGGKVTIPLGDLAANTAVNATVVVTNNNLVSKTNIASVSTASQDTNPSNNSATNWVAATTPTLQIVPGAAILTYESGPRNGFIDLGETNTLELYLQNVGNISSTNLVATLLATNGVLLNSGPQIQTYGVIAPANSAHRPFTFTTASSNGGTILATLRLQDTSSTNIVAFTLLSRANFSSSSAITIPDHGIAGAYPSTIIVAGLTGIVSKAAATLNGISHSFPLDVNALLANPAANDVVLISHAGGPHALNNLILTFDDSATNSLPANDQIIGGTFKPTSYGTVTFPSPAPSAPYGSTLASVAGTDPNGQWSLYVFDDATGDSGNIANGWSLDLTTTPVIVPPVLSASANEGQLQLSITAQPGVYVIFGSTDFNNWLPLSTNAVSSSGTISFTDSTGLPYRYYRAARQLP